MANILELHDSWASHPLGRNRAAGGRRALRGFLYQLYLTLDRFFDLVLAGDTKAKLVFEGLSDLAEAREGLIYLTQVKSTITRESLRDAVREALAVDTFLEETQPSQRNRLRYQIAARRSPAVEPYSQPAKLAATDLGLEAAEAERWEAVRAFFLPVVAHGAPEVDLAIKLWPHSVQCFDLITSCVGRLLELLGENCSSEEITRELLKIWNRRPSEKPPLNLLSVRSYSAMPSEARRIVHGTRPTQTDLADGCFMERPQWLEDAISRVVAIWEKAERHQGRPGLAFLWITGPSGSGKSVLLLQLVRELILRGLVETVNDLGEFTHRLPQALRYWAQTTQRVVIALDDLYAPASREPRLWREVAELAATCDWKRTPVVVTCGPSEQLHAFRKFANRHSGVVLESFELSPLSREEREQFHSWYQERVSAQVARSNEPILVAATWIYELGRSEGLSPDAFVQRFSDRLQELELFQEARTALAFNGYNLRAPEKLFEGKEVRLNRFVAERIYRLPTASTGRAGFFFHPRIAAILYDGMVPRDQLSERSQDLARGYLAIVREPGEGKAFLDWLSQDRRGSRLSPALLDEVLAAIWPVFNVVGASEEVVPQVFQWYQILRSREQKLVQGRADRIIKRWLQDAPGASKQWPLLFQLVWTSACHAERDVLFGDAVVWLEDLAKGAGWTYIWRCLWDHRPREPFLEELGLLWIFENASHRGWGFVWQAIFKAGLRSETLADAGIEGVLQGPDSPAEVPIWGALETLVPRDRFLDVIIRKASRMGYLRTAVTFYLERVGAEGPIGSARRAFEATFDEPSWPRLWLEVSLYEPADRELHEIGKAWLEGREDRPEWNYVWQRLLEAEPGGAGLLSLGRSWLEGREDRPEWAHVWERLLEAEPGGAGLLSLGRSWLEGREDRPEWPFVWECLEAGSPQHTTFLVDLAKSWFREHGDHPIANRISRKIKI